MSWCAIIDEGIAGVQILGDLTFSLSFSGAENSCCAQSMPTTTADASYVQPPAFPVTSINVDLDENELCKPSPSQPAQTDQLVELQEILLDDDASDYQSLLSPHLAQRYTKVDQCQNACVHNNKVTFD
jgi:hypothetical protein